ncbi:MAG: cytochrome c3 family protein [Proteobacteria bacterium]|nr:cytochrome c3 family protein [Pseudomonadota bacterium]
MAFGCPEAPNQADQLRYPIAPQDLLPTAASQNDQVATGKPTGVALEQPIAFPHFTHVTTLEIQCEYCHSEARKSIHAGFPPVNTCIGCHRFAMAKVEEIKKIQQYYDQSTSIPWKKVHDLPDYVFFSHEAHYRAGVDCAECHGPVESMGQPQQVGTTEAGEPILKATNIMVRQNSLQMGWCLDCHDNHPYVENTYGESAALRQAELSDCLICHK